ncbi:MAG: ACT domain-containing protein [Planctomycetes bacterium]|nr:ACT domain-containing protein [Planctomycetota bacterium]
MIEKQLSVLLENKVGVLAEVCKMLAAHGINIKGISISDTVDHAVLRLIVDDWHGAIHILGEHGALVVETDVIRVRLDDKPGELATLAENFAREEVNIEYAYGTSDVNGATLYLRVSDVKRAEQIIQQK